MFLIDQGEISGSGRTLLQYLQSLRSIKNEIIPNFSFMYPKIVNHLKRSELQADPPIQLFRRMDLSQEPEDNWWTVEV